MVKDKFADKFAEIEKSLFPEKLGSVYFQTKDVGRMIGVSDQTVREMAQKFSEFIEPLLEKTEGGHRRFSEQAVNVLAYIKHLNKNEDMTYDAILGFFKEKKPQVTSVTPIELKNLEALMQVGDQNKIILQGLFEIKRSIDLYQQTIEQQSAAITELTNKVQALEEAGQSNKEEIITVLQERSDKIDQVIRGWRETHSEKKGFFGRIFGK